MEKKLQHLFDYQRIQKNKKLDGVIHDTVGGGSRELSPDELDRVNAAGAIYNEGSGNGVVLITTAANPVIVPRTTTAPCCSGICEYKDSLGETKQGQYSENVAGCTESEKEALARSWCTSQGFTFVSVVQ